jgi:hypothetical protein
MGAPAWPADGVSKTGVSISSSRAADQALTRNFGTITYRQ